MKELPQYNLFDFMGWLTTRSVPLNQSACSTFLSIVNNDPDFSSWVMNVAGMKMENSMFFASSLSNILGNQKFKNISQSIIVPPTLYTYIEMAYFLTNSPLDDRMVTMLMTTVSMTPEFSGILTQLDGINSGNSLNYQAIIRYLLYYPIFQINAQQFYLLDEDK